MVIPSLFVPFTNDGSRIYMMVPSAETADSGFLMLNLFNCILYLVICWDDGGAVV